MGGNLRATTAAWTFLYLLQLLSADKSLFQDLGLNGLLDASKINISQDEYTRMMTLYLDSRRQRSSENSIPHLITFHNVRKSVWSFRQGPRLKFSIQPSNLEVESAQLRILAPAHPLSSVKVQVTQVLGAKRRKVIEEKVVYLSPNLTKWCDFDVTSAVQSWLSGERNLGLELVCMDCSNNFLKPIQAAVSALVYSEHRRFRRGTSPYQPLRRTDCRDTPEKGKKKCCRYNMSVTFSDIDIPEMQSIIQPKVYEAGYCHGQCPRNYNPASNHSRIQSLLHHIEKKNATIKLMKKRLVPKACCTPSKLEPLDILMVNPSETNKLMLKTWENMKVVECACS